MRKVRTRIAPSPTGYMHIGTARTALFNYLYAKKYGGDFILRIEDTDKERSKAEHESTILDSLTWLSLEWDAFYRQSDRSEIYKEAVRVLLENGSAYISKENTENGRDRVIRFKNPNKEIQFIDQIRGKITFDTSELNDFIIAKSEREPLYHLAVVVDDGEMEIKNVIRGEDHISNTPRQILILEALGYEIPEYAHIPLILAPDKSRLSKRHGSISILEYRDRGFLPEAVINYLAMLGWNPGTDEEIFSLKDLITEFSINRVQKGGCIFDEEKLKWFNKKYIQISVSDEDQYSEFEKRIMNNKRCADRGWTFLERENKLRLLWGAYRERFFVYEDMDLMLESGEFDYYFEQPELEADKLIWKDQSKEDAIKHLQYVKERIISLNEKKFSDQESIKNMIWDYATKNGRGDVLWPMRYALSGRERSPDPFTLSSILGKDRTVLRLEEAIDML